jgi:hypothetical protein
MKLSDAGPKISFSGRTAENDHPKFGRWTEARSDGSVLC